MKTLHRSWILAIIFAVAAAFLLAQPSVGKKGGGGGGKREVLHGCVTTDSGPALTGDAVSNTYCHVDGGSPSIGLESFWRLTNDQTGRKVFFDFSGFQDLSEFENAGVTLPTEPIDLSFFISDFVDVNTGELTDAGLAEWRAMPEGQPQDMRGGIDFDGSDSDGFGFSLFFGLGLSANNGGGEEGMASPLTVTRTATDTWTIASTGGNVILRKRLKTKGRQFLIGTGHFNFTMTYTGAP